MKRSERDLIRIEREVIAAKRFLKEKRAELAATRYRLKRDNATRTIRNVDKTLESLRQHRHVVEELAARPSVRRKRRGGNRAKRKRQVRTGKKRARTSKRKAVRR
jgi:hypothetical protein